MKHIGMAIGVAILLAGGCELADIGTEIKYVGPFQTTLPLDCRMQMLFGPLPVPHQDIARAKTECPDHTFNEELCFDDMRRKACLVGADSVYGIAEVREGGVSYLTATFAHNLPGPSGDDVWGATTASSCNPICSPGFACQQGLCLPQCNPGCATNQVCTWQRVCAPVAAPVSKL
jgi:hypothetical protein